MKKYIIFSILITGLLILNLTRWHLVDGAMVLALIYLVYFGRRLGVLALPQLSGFWQRLFGPLLLLAFFSIAGSLIYYFYQIDNYSVSGLLVAVPILLIPFARYLKKDIADWSEGLMEPVPMVEPNTGRYNFWWWLVFLGDLYLLWFLYSHGTDLAIRSPWTVLSYKFFVAFFILSLALFVYLRKISSSIRSLGIIFLHSLLILSVAVLIYHLGFGFDPYLHRAAEQHILQTGVIEPKTPYYIGQYALVAIICKITALSVDIVDRWLLIILEAVFLAPLFFLIFRRVFNLERKEAKIGSLLIYLLPFSHLIATTPQDTANFFAVAAICFSLIYLSGQSLRFVVPLLLVLATIFTHPLTGVPLLLAIIILFLLRLRQKYNLKILWNFLITLIFLASLVILPVIFITLQGASFSKPEWSDLWHSLPSLWPTPLIKHSWKFFPFYLYQNLLPYILFILALWGGKKFQEKQKMSAPVSWLFLSFVIFIVNALLLKISVYFRDIGLAEQTQYSERLGHFSLYLLLPLGIYGLFSVAQIITNKTKNKKMLLIFSLVAGLFFACTLTASLYLSYPRVDAYALSRYINTSAADFAAVKKIEETSGGTPYFVLSNISVSAAAIKEYGFKTYFTTPAGEKIFYYALPTGGPLYHYFEDMVYKSANRETMLKVMNLTGTSQGFLVINDYWDSFKKVLPEARTSADEWWNVEEKVYVFKYQNLTLPSP